MNYNHDQEDVEDLDFTIYEGNSNSASDFFDEFQNVLATKNNIKDKFYIKIVNKQSLVWNYFGFLYSKKSNKVYFSKFKFCKPCFEKEKWDLKKFALLSSTNTLKNHLIRAHDIIFEDEDEVQKQKNSKNQLLIKDLFGAGGTTNSFQLNKITNSNNKKYCLARTIALMCALDFEPFEIVEKIGFIKLVESLGIKSENIPSSRTIADNGLNDIYLYCLKSVKQIIKESPKYVNIILDCWTDRYKKRAYITYRLQFAKDFKMYLVTLSTHLLERPHTAQQIRNDLNNLLSNFNLTDKILTAISDNGRNIIAALKLCKIKRISCAAHNINLLINVDILQNEKYKVLREYCIKLRKLHQALCYKGDELAEIDLTNKKQELFEWLEKAEQREESFILDEQFVFGSEEDPNDYLRSISETSSTLKINNVTRWNSIYTMIESFITNYKNVNILLTLLNKSYLIIGEIELIVLKEFAKFLKIFQECTVTLQGCKYPTSNLYLLFYIRINKKVKELQLEVSTGIMIQLLNDIDDLIKQRYPISEEHLIASLLDPSQKNLKSLNELLPDQISKEDFLLRYILKHQIQFDKDEVNIKKQRLSNRLNFIQDIEEEEIQNDKWDEINLYFISKTGKDMEPLDWWADNGKIFPHLCELAQIYLGLPATSAAAEMAFSTAGMFLSAKRSLLNPSKLSKLCFIHDNYGFIKSVKGLTEIDLTKE